MDSTAARERDTIESVVDRVQAFLGTHGVVQFIRLHWVDLSGIIRTRIVPKAQALRLANKEVVYRLGSICMASTCSDAQPNDSIACRPFELRPDWSSLKHCTFAPKHAAVMCFTVSPEDPDPKALCTRTLLSEVLAQRDQGQPMSFLIGSEIEFVLLDEGMEAYSPLDALEGWSHTGGLRGKVLTILETIAENLSEAGIGVWHFHTELARQLEISLNPLPPMEAIDAVYFAIETIKSVAVAHGLRATVAPKPLLNGIINGLHLHLSIDPKHNKDHFLAGILNHLHSVLVLAVANYDGYARVGTGSDRFFPWSSWGTSSGELPIVIKDEARWELRFPDATANLYLLVAVLLHLGLEGVRKSSPLTVTQITRSVKSFTEEQLHGIGVTQSLPKTFEEALKFYSEDSACNSIVSKEMKEYYTMIKQKDLATCREMDEEDRRRWFLRFF